MSEGKNLPAKVDEVKPKKTKKKELVVSDKIENVLINGDLSQLDASERKDYYLAVCKSLNINPLTKPFDYLHLNNKLQLYANKDCTAQIRRNECVSIHIKSRQLVGDVFIVTATAIIKEREDEAIGAVNIKGLFGDALANAYMKAETKAKRRVTLSISGLGFLDESEIESIPKEQTQKPATPAPSPPKKITTPSPAQLKRLYTIVGEQNWTPEDVHEYMEKKYQKKSSKELSIIEYNLLCAEILVVKKPQTEEQRVGDMVDGGS